MDFILGYCLISIDRKLHADKYKKSNLQSVILLLIDFDNTSIETLSPDVYFIIGRLIYGGT